MPRLCWLFALPILILALAVPAKAEPQASIQSGWPGVFKAESKSSDGFAEDALSLTVSDHGKQIASSIFCSSYGKAAARVIIDKSGGRFVLLSDSEGRGTNAWTDYLELDRIQKPDLLEVLRVPLSWATGPDRRFTYSYVIELPRSGGIRIRLKGQNSGEAVPNMDCCVPDQNSLMIDVSGR